LGGVCCARSGLAKLALDDVFGFELLQVGEWGPARHWLDAARTQHTTLLAPEAGRGQPVRTLTELPFRSDSIDAILLPHTLELVEDLMRCCASGARALRRGVLLICGFNPYSDGRAPPVLELFPRPPFPPQTRGCWRAAAARLVALLDFEVADVYGYLGMLPMAGRPRKLDATSAEPQQGRRPALTAGGYLLKPASGCRR